MSQQLFSTGKTLLFLDDYKPGLEKRKSGETKILTLTLRCQPFNRELAGAIDDGLGGDTNVKSTLFKLNQPEQKPHLRRVNFELGCPRQNLRIFASTDTEESRIFFEQVRIAGVYARTQKDISGYTFVFKASFGPVGRAEQEYIHEWMLTQRAVTFEESEPNLDFELDTDDEEDGEAEEVVEQQAPMWEEPARATTPRKPKTAKKKGDNVNRKLHSHQGGKKKGKR